MKLIQIAVAFDQLINTIFGGYADETMSSRCWRLRSVQPYTTLQKLVDRLFWFDPRHCEMSYNSERQRKYLPPELR